MKEFKVILKYEIKSYLENKLYLITTVFLAIAILIVMFLPRITENFYVQNNSQYSNKGTMLISVEDEYKDTIKSTFELYFPDYTIIIEKKEATEINTLLESEMIECAFVITELTNYTYYVKDLAIKDSNLAIVDEILKTTYQAAKMSENGITLEVANEILSTEIIHNVECIGENQASNFYYTYIMLMALYIVIFLYGNMVANGVAEEKGSRVMELLVTSTKPLYLLLGKIAAACLAGLGQLALIFGVAFLSYKLNANYWKSNYLVSAVLDAPMDLLIYMLIFFVLGFLCYAFIFGAVGSMVSKLDELSTAIIPVYILLVAAFMLVVFGMLDNVNGMLLKVCSFIPITSPIAMFTRIAMSNVPLFEIIISISLIILFIICTGVISARIYKECVMIYNSEFSIIKKLKK